jgi:hypothetical protein
MNMKRLLPSGIQDFADIRERGFCYVDKTAVIHQLISGSGKPFFLSRPRRFGKSLLCSTLEAIFEGRRELFGKIAGRPALAIDSLDWEWKKHPVIRLDLNAGIYSNGEEVLHKTLIAELKAHYEEFGIEREDEDIISQFKYLIRKAHEKSGEKVVVIIDEYDKPLIETMDQPTVHDQLRKVLKAFYGVLKSYDKHLRLVFITGVTKFSHVSIFSDLNQLTDLTLNPDYAVICGLTQEEVEQNFDPEIKAIMKKTGKSRKEYLEELRSYYNGYRFSEEPLTVYNPFVVLQHFVEKGKFKAYWYETATPTFLVKLIVEKKVNILNLTNMLVGDADFRKYDIENMRVEPLLYQTGYLTITDYDEEADLYTLDFPNIEVHSSFTKSLLDQYLESSNETAGALHTRLMRALLKGDIKGAMNAMPPFFAAIPYDLIEERENYYHLALHLIFNILGFNCRSEVRTADGRIDSIVETKSFVYCFEFKLDKSAKEALAQINTKKYLLPWKGSGKKLFKIGVDFNHETRNIGEWIYETVDA